MSVLPTDDKLRKNLPIFRLITRYFPKGLREVTKVAVANNVRYNPDKEPADINWARGKSTDQFGSLFRHIFEAEVDGTVFEPVSKEVTEKTGIDQVYVLAEAAWRTLAALELEIERQEAAKPGELVAVPLGTVALTPLVRVSCLVNPGAAPQMGCGCFNCNDQRTLAMRL